MLTIWPSGYTRTAFDPNRALTTSKAYELVKRDEANTHAPFHVNVSGFHGSGILVIDTPYIYVPSYGLGRTLHLQADFYCTSTSGMATVYLQDYYTGISGANFTISGSSIQRKELTLVLADGRRDVAGYFQVMGLVTGEAVIHVHTSGLHMNCWTEA